MLHDAQGDTAIHAPTQRTPIAWRRHFCPEGIDPYDTVRWQARDAEIKDADGAVVFVQRDCLFPADWSALAVNIVASKYFWGRAGSSGREHSLRQVVGRVVSPIARWGLADGYFAEEEDARAYGDDLAWLILHQHGAFNSPVWFNVGCNPSDQGWGWDQSAGDVARCDPSRDPQYTASACFILGTRDDIPSIGGRAVDEMAVFKDGSGAGSDNSRVRSSRERIRGGGLASGPVSFMKIYDAVAAVTKSGGRCLAPDQPVFTAAGPRQVAALEAAGEDFIVLSHSRRLGRVAAKTARACKSGRKRVVSIVTDKAEFRVSADHNVMLRTGEACRADDLRPGMRLKPISTKPARGGYVGVRLESRRGAPVELLHRLVAADVLGWDTRGRVVHHDNEDKVDCVPTNLVLCANRSEHVALHNARKLADGSHPFLRRDLGKHGEANGMHASSDFWQDKTKVVAYKEKQGAILAASGRAATIQKLSSRQKMLNTGYRLLNAGYGIEDFEGYYTARKLEIGKIGNSKAALLAKFEAQFDGYAAFLAELGEGNHRVIEVRDVGEMDVYSVEVDDDEPDDKRPWSEHNFMLAPYGDDSPFAAGIAVFNSRRAAKMEILRCDHPDIMEFIEAKGNEEKKARALEAAGYSGGMNGEASASVMFQNSNFSTRLTDDFMDAAAEGRMWPTLAVATGDTVGVDGEKMPAYDASALLDLIAQKTWECGDPGVQFDAAIQGWHTCPRSGRIWGSNPCSEFLFLDDTACNLASLRLKKFLRDDGDFDTESFRHACRTFLVAQEVLVDHAAYPTAEIARNSHAHRPLGLGYADLGALLMSMGLPYDSDAGRAAAASITAIMQGEAALTSIKLARAVGPFEGFEANRSPMIRVMEKHREHAYKGQTEAHDVATRRLAAEANSVWCAVDDACHMYAFVGFRNAQLSVLAPTGCVATDTLVLTDRGLRRIRSLGDAGGPRWQDADFRVQTAEGPQAATKFFVNGVAHVVAMETKNGYRFRATPKHRIKVVAKDGTWKWRRMGRLQAGDVVPLQLGGMLGEPVASLLPPRGPLDPRATEFATPGAMTHDLAELLGAFMANGSLHEKGIRVSVCRCDAALTSRTVELFAEVFGIVATVEPDSGSDEVVSVVVNSTPLRRWWELAGFAKIPPFEGHRGKGYKAHVPDAILATNDPIAYSRFLRGLTDHDGTVAEGCPEIQSADRAFISDIQVMALALGFPTRLRSTISGFSGRPLWRARVVNRHYSPRWSETVGFTEARKADAIDVVTSMSGRNDIVRLPSEVIDRVCPIGHADRAAATMAVSRAHGLTRTMAQRLYRETRDEELKHYLGFYYDVVTEARLEDRPIETLDLSVPSNVTYTAAGLQSHNTIAFMMDCDTTGVEPDLALVKYKTLAGGGRLKLVNRSVPAALRKLGYPDATIDLVVAYIDEHDTIEGCPVLDPAHLPVFDCAFPPAAAKAAMAAVGFAIQGRSIDYTGHIAMMAAVQPFISGSLSKTINMCEFSTVSDIRDAYVLAWKSGLKAVAIYRDNSKAAQPMTTSKGVGAKAVAKPDDPPGGTPGRNGDRLRVTDDATCPPRREKLPDSRAARTFKFRVGEHKGYMHAGFYDDGRLGELFVTMDKEGSTLAGVMDAVATAVSLGLQHGVPLETFVRKFAFTTYEPKGFTNDPDVRQATSLTDYIFRKLGILYVPGYAEEMGVTTREAPSVPQGEAGAAEALSFVEADEDRLGALEKLLAAEPRYRMKVRSHGDIFPSGGARLPRRAGDGPPCPLCGHVTRRAGSCYVCNNCGGTSGCG